MIDPPHIVETPEQLTAVIQVTVPRDQIQNVMGPGLEELTAVLGAQGIVPSGPWFTHHFRMQPGIFDFEIGMPVTATVASARRVKPGQLPAATVARTVYHGPYSGLPGAWREFEAWIAANGHTSAPDLWECYVANQSTQLNRPLIVADR